MERSIEPEAMCSPVGEKRVAKTSPVWPVDVGLALSLYMIDLRLASKLHDGCLQSACAWHLGTMISISRPSWRIVVQHAVQTFEEIV